MRLAPETAHAAVGHLLNVFQKTPSRSLVAPHISIRSLPQLRLRNRLGLAAGFDKNGQWARAMHLLGFGFVEVGTVTPLPQAGNPPPRLWRIPEKEALVNQMGFNNCGLKQFSENLRRYPRLGPVIANIGRGKSIENAIADYIDCLRGLTGLVDGFVINVSSPNTPGIRDLQSPRFIEELAPHLPQGVPVWIKLAPDLTGDSLNEILNAVNDTDGLSGVCLTNTSKRLALELYGFNEGGLSGRPLFTRALEMVATAKQRLKPHKTLIGVGGVATVADARAMRNAGADLVEIYTAFIYGGPERVREIASSLSQ